MMPGETSPKPGRDSMGMDMVPVYEEEAQAGSSTITIDAVTTQNMDLRTGEVIRGYLLAAIVASAKAPRLSGAGRWSVTTCMAPVTISQPVAPRKPPITG